MGFEDQVITSRGAQLIRQAVADSDKIVFTRAIAGSHWDESRGDLSAKPIEWYDGADGSISAVSTSNGVLQVVASFSGSGTNPVKSVCICAQIAKDGLNPEYDPADDVVFAATCDDNSCYVSGDSFKIQFTLPVAVSSLVDAVGTVDPDVVHTSGDQSIDGSLAIDGDLSVSGNDSSLSFRDDLVITDMTVDNGDSIMIHPTALYYKSEGEADYTEFYISTMPLKCEYNTTAGTVTLTLGNGHVVKLTCTSVEEDPE